MSLSPDLDTGGCPDLSPGRRGEGGGSHRRIDPACGGPTCCRREGGLQRIRRVFSQEQPPHQQEDHSVISHIKLYFFIDVLLIQGLTNNGLLDSNVDP